MIVLGIDPGSRCCGYGVVQLQTMRCQHIAHGTIRLSQDEVSHRLYALLTSLQDLMRQYQPDSCAVENVFVAGNPNSALKLGQARGVALAAAASCAIPVHGYAPRSVKKSVSTSGAADKAAVQRMVTHLLHLEKPPAHDAADALAVAWCHAQHTLFSVRTIRSSPP